MRTILVLAALAALSRADTGPADHAHPIEYPTDNGNNTLEARDEPPWPGWLECKQGEFKKPCTWTPSGGRGAKDCHKMIYTEGQKHPGGSFGPDKGVTCRLYDSSDCAQGGRPLNVVYPGGDLLKLGRDAGSFIGIEGFWSYRCRSWKQKDNDAEQSKWIALPKKP